MKRQDYTLLAPSHLIEWNYHRERLDRDPWGVDRWSPTEVGNRNTKTYIDTLAETPSPH